MGGGRGGSSWSEQAKEWSEPFCDKLGSGECGNSPWSAAREFGPDPIGRTEPLKALE